MKPKFKVGDELCKILWPDDKEWQNTILLVENDYYKVRFKEGAGSGEESLLYPMNEMENDFELYKPHKLKKEFYQDLKDLLNET